MRNKIFVAFLLLLGAVFAAEVYQTKMGSADVFVISLTTREINPSILLPQTDEEKELIATSRTFANQHNIVLVKAPNYILLVDTGFASTTLALEEVLQSLDVRFEDITHVLITHGHGDHVGAIVDEAGNNRFSNATLLLDQKEYDFWAQSPNDTARNAFESFGNKRVFVQHNMNLFPQSTLQISTSPAYGHTPGHLIVKFAFKEQNLVFFADILHNFAVQTKAPQISTTYDTDKLQAAQTRMRLLEQFRTQKIPVVGTHVPFVEPIVLE